MICRRKVAEDAAAPAALAAVAQLVERVLGKDEVTGPSPVSSSDEIFFRRKNRGVWPRLSSQLCTGNC